MHAHGIFLYILAIAGIVAFVFAAKAIFFPYKSNVKSVEGGGVTIGDQEKSPSQPIQ